MTKRLQSRRAGKPVTEVRPILVGDYWVATDGSNNKWLGRMYTGERAAIAAASMKNCRDCTNCQDCTDCIRCRECQSCTDCHDCRGCLECKNSSDCCGCTDCDNCRRCESCKHCNNCLACDLCVNCSICSFCRNAYRLPGNSTHTRPVQAIQFDQLSPKAKDKAMERFLPFVLGEEEKAMAYCNAHDICFSIRGNVMIKDSIMI